MAKKVKISVTGIKELDKKLVRLGKEVSSGKKVMRRALRGGTKIIQAEAKARVPVDTGQLARSIKVRAKRSRRHIRYVVISGDTSFTGRFYSSFVELGYTKKDGTHVPAQPFLRSAFHTKKAEAARYIKKHALIELGNLIQSL